MVRMIVLSATLLAFGGLFALPAQAEDTMMKKDEIAARYSGITRMKPMM